MKHYQPKRNNPYRLPHGIYHQTLWQIKNYYWTKEHIEDIIMATPDYDGQPKGNGISDPTFSKVSKLGRYSTVVKVIEEERDKILPEYRQGVWSNIQFGTRYPNDADPSTYSRHKSKFVYGVAVRLGFYDKP